jgi:hypothetical protein
MHYNCQIYFTKARIIYSAVADPRAVEAAAPYRDGKNLFIHLLMAEASQQYGPHIQLRTVLTVL